jgi:hypothetical protein
VHHSQPVQVLGARVELEDGHPVVHLGQAKAERGHGRRRRDAAGKRGPEHVQAGAIRRLPLEVGHQPGP